MRLIEPRETLAMLKTQEGETYVGLSRLLGRPDDYLSRYVRGRAGELSREDATTLGRYFGIDPRRLGGDAPPLPASPRRRWRPEQMPRDRFAGIERLVGAHGQR